MKDYKKSFVISNLLLIGLVLLIMNTVIMVYSYHTNTEEIKTQMQQKIEPYNTIRDILKERPGSENTAPPEAPSAPDNENDAALPETRERFFPRLYVRKMHGEAEGKYFKSIYVFFYNIAEENVTVISKNELTDDNELLETAKKIYAKSDDFGVLKSEDLYYYKQSTPNELKISVADRNFIRFAMLELFGVLLLVFAFAMLIFYFINRKLADRAAKPLEDAIAREKQFITDASHDLKTPLTVILSNADILARDKADDGTAKWVDGTKQAAVNMKELIEQMLVLSESESKPEVKCEEVNISDIAEQNALVMESVAYEKNISFETHIQPGIMIRGNADYVKRIVSSLIDNAVKYEKSGGNIRVCLHKDKKGICFSVENKLSIISAEDLPHVFERFYRAEKSRHMSGSHGLGLAIVKNLTELMNGEIEVTSTETDGTKFTVTFFEK